jgi:hypothetical protein
MTKSKFRRSARIAGGLAFCGVIALGAFAPMAGADERGGGERHDNDRGDQRGWSSGGYYVAPPVVYGSPYYQPYYAPPPIVYGPSVGVFLPGINIGIH